VQQVRDYGEIDMSDPNVLSAFLQRAYTRFPPSADRKYFLALWDHGGGWNGYGIDHTCNPLKSYNPDGGCNMLSVPLLVKGAHRRRRPGACRAASRGDVGPPRGPCTRERRGPGLRWAPWRGSASAAHTHSLSPSTLQP
jgi:hypothetical protein